MNCSVTHSDVISICVTNAESMNIMEASPTVVLNLFNLVFTQIVISFSLSFPFGKYEHVLIKSSGRFHDVLV